jgi:hypothetical protein
MNMVEKRTRVILLGAGIALAVTGVSGMYARAAGKAQATAQTASLTMDPSALAGGPGSKARVGYMPVPVVFTDDKPAGITKEPAYKSKPKYAVIHIGNGPKSAYNLAFDEPADGDWKVYIDKNQNGDLTDDGDGSWSKKNSNNGRTVYGVNNYVLRASWGTPTVEKSHDDYGIALYRIDTIAKNAFMYREAARSGALTFAGKKHNVLLVENDGDALYSKSVQTDAVTGKPAGKVTGRAVWLLVDTNDDGKFSLGEGSMFDVRAPFKVGDVTYEA